MNDKKIDIGLMEATEMVRERDLTREQWIEECFPEWGTYLNKQIEREIVKDGKVALWWLGGPSWVLKSQRAIALIDNYAGPSHYTLYDYCGVCRTTGAERLEWLRLNPQLIDPWKFESIDALFSTHHHADHCDIYTVKALLKTTAALFVGPKYTCTLFRKWGVPEERIREVRPGDILHLKDIEVLVEKNYDDMARKTKTGLDNVQGNIDYDDVAVTFIFKTSGGNVAFLGDTLYNNGYAGVGARNKIDVTILNMGHNAPGGTDKLTPFDAYRIGQALKTEVLIPDHYENWASSVIDPEQLEWIVQKNDPNMKTVILKWAAKFVYPDDKNIGRYKYSDWSERYCPERSIDYGNKENNGK
jgi:L-ascorbate 6-phosphate lactonase